MNESDIDFSAPAVLSGANCPDDDELRNVDSDLRGIPEDTGGQKQYQDKMAFPRSMAAAYKEFLNQGVAFEIQYFTKGYVRIGRTITEAGATSLNETNTGLGSINVMLHQAKIDLLRDVLDQTYEDMDSQKTPSRINRVISTPSTRGYRTRYFATGEVTDDGMASAVNTDGTHYIAEDSPPHFVLTVEKMPAADKMRDRDFDGKCVIDKWNMKKRSALHFHNASDIANFVSVLYSKMPILCEIPKDMKEPWLRVITQMARTAQHYKEKLATEGNPRRLDPWKMLLALVDTFRTDPTNTTVWSNVRRAGLALFKGDKESVDKNIATLRFYVIKNSPLTLTRMLCLRKLWHKAHAPDEMDDLEKQLKDEEEGGDDEDEEETDENKDPNTKQQMPVQEPANSRKRKLNLSIPAFNDEKKAAKKTTMR